jgi:hypothetical protein
MRGYEGTRYDAGNGRYDSEGACVRQRHSLIEWCDRQSVHGWFPLFA